MLALLDGGYGKSSTVIVRMFTSRMRLSEAQPQLAKPRAQLHLRHKNTEIP